MWNKSIRFKVLILVLSVVILFGTLLAFYSPYMTKKMGRKILKNNAEFITHLLRENLALSIQTRIFDNGESLQQSLDLLKTDVKNAAIANVSVFDPDMSFIRGLNTTQKQVDFRPKDKLILNEHKEILEVWSPIKDNDQNLLGYVNINFSKAFLNQQARKSGNFYILLTLLIMGLTIAASFFLSKNISGIIGSITTETKTLTESVKSGYFNKRGESKHVNQEFRPIITAMNELIDAFVEPIHMLEKYITRIGKGDIPQKITQDYQGDFNEIKESINLAIDGMSGLMESNRILQNAAVNDYTQKVTGEYKGIFQEVAQAVNIMIDRMNRIQDIVLRVSQGNLSDLEPLKKEGKRCENDQISLAFIAMEESIQGLVNETKTIIEQTKSGHLDSRGNPAAFQGEYQNIIQGFNETLEAIVQPLKVIGIYIDRIAQGDLDKRITVKDEKTNIFKGDFENYKNNVNRCMDNVQELVDQINQQSQDAINGHLDTRIEMTDFTGDYRKVVEGVNKTIDALESPLKEVSGVMAEVADRDLTKRMEGRYKGQLLTFKADVNEAINNLHKALNQVNMAIEQVTAASDQITSGSQSLAEGTNEQASSLEDISSTLEEMSSMTSKTSENVDQANTLMEAAKSTADQGSQAMQKMTAAINKIKNTADESAKIIKTIDDIAFQTNLLALNAAVEAARAGEAGKGFAVVASEVRSLAQRSAEAAKSTAQLIEESIHNASAGVDITHESSDQLKEIVDRINKGANLIKEINAATKEQATGIEEINGSISEVNNVTQNNASNSEESASAAQELNSQAQQLANMIATFTFKSNEALESNRKELKVRQKSKERKSHSQKTGGDGDMNPKIITPDDVIPLDDKELDDF